MQRFENEPQYDVEERTKKLLTEMNSPEFLNELAAARTRRTEAERAERARRYEELPGTSTLIANMVAFLSGKSRVR